MRFGNVRPFDLRLPSNRYLFIAVPVAGAAAGVAVLSAGEVWGEALLAGIRAGGSGFLAWAIAREVAPDHPILAGVAVTLAPWGVIAGPPDLLAAATLLLVVRAVAGTTGRPPHWADAALLAVVAAGAAAEGAGTGSLAVAAGALWGAAALVDRRRAVCVVAAVGTGLLAMVAWLLLDAVAGWSWWTGLASLPGAVTLAGPGAVRSTPDRGDVIAPGRVRLARLSALLGGMCGAFTGGTAAAIPVFVGLGVVALKPR